MLLGTFPWLECGGPFTSVQLFLFFYVFETNSAVTMRVWLIFTKFVHRSKQLS